jgi:Na+/glutamate symporter
MIVSVEVAWGVSMAFTGRDTWDVMVLGGLLCFGAGAGPQAVIRIMAIQATNKVLNTFAVYHKIYPTCEILNPCE